MKLCIHEKILEQHVAVLGKTGAGKSSALRHIVEHLLDSKKRVCIVDPKGDWWGLKKSADGKSVGYEDIICFGDFKNPKATDIPINEHSGKQVAELIANGNRPCVIGFRGWMTGRMIHFWIDFASTLFTSNSGELYLVGDEFHNFAPKGKIMEPESGKCLHWSNRLMSEGRGYGLVCLIASQRPQKVHNDTLTCCETLVAMRVIHKADRDAAQDWIEGCGDMAKGKEVLDALAGMARGEAYVWSPEIGFGPTRLKFPMFETFDSFAPPQLQKKVSESGWEAVNLDTVKEKLAAVIEEQKANDPSELKAKVRALEKQLKEANASHGKTLSLNESKVKEVPALTDHERKRLTALIESYDRMESVCSRIETMATEIKQDAVTNRAEVTFFKLLLSDKLKAAVPPASYRETGNIKHSRTNTLSAREIVRAVKPVASTLNGSEFSIGKCERAILTALAQYPQGRTACQVALLAQYSVNSGGFNNSLGKLRSGGFITRGQPIQITDEGLALLGDYQPLPTGDELARHWINSLGKCEASILTVLVESYPNSMTSQEVADATGYSRDSGGFNNSLGRLRTLELITQGQPIKASEDFFQ